MISILIPTYNYVCTSLAEALSRQGRQLREETNGSFDFELIAGDDCSTDRASVQANRAINKMPGCRLWEAPHNLGRAAIRNRLAEQARMPYLLFIDSDAQVVDEHFLLRYWQCLPTCPVVCGGVHNVPSLPSPRVLLRYRYEDWLDKKRSATQRSRMPYAEFTTFNFAVSAQVFHAAGGFNEQCHEYGYEDVAFGMQLKERGIPIKHIDNALIHLGLDESACFLEKIEASLRTLHSLDSSIQAGSAVARTAARLKALHLRGAMRCFHTVFRGAERRILLGNHPSIAVLSIYKLGYYCSL